jgi:hypothetical protein
MFILKSYIYLYIIVVQRVGLWLLHMCLQYIFIRFTLPSFSLIPLLLRTISTGFITLFSYINTKIIPPYSPFLYHPSPRHTGVYLQKGPVFNFLSFIYLKVYIDSQRGFALALHIYIYHALIRLTSPYYSFFLYHSHSLLFNSLHHISALCYIIFIHRCNVSILFTL